MSWNFVLFSEKLHQILHENIHRRKKISGLPVPANVNSGWKKTNGFLILLMIQMG